MKKIIYSIITTCLLLFLIFPITTKAATIASGTHGDNATWSLSDSGVLTITGKGELEAHGRNYSYPWYPYRSQIKEVITSIDVKTIPTLAFYEYDQLTKVTLQGVELIDMSAFEDCPSLKTVKIEGKTTEIKNSAFYKCKSLKTINLPDTITYIGSSVFRYCDDLSSIKLPTNLESFGTNVFTDSGLTTITIPAKTKNLSSAFYYCSYLKEIHFSGDYIDTLDEHTFWDVTATAYYPKGNSTWTKDKRLDYGGDLTWVAEDLFAIETQPKGVAVGNGETAETIITAIGSGLKYQWYYKNPGSSSFKKSSVTAAKYFCTMKEATSGRKIYCIVTNSEGKTLKSKTVTLSMIDITKQPANKQAPLGSTIKTSFTAKGDDLTYQWYVKDKGEDSYTKSAKTSASYSYKMTTAKSGRKAYCLITDKYGNKLKTRTATLSAATSITKQPTNAKALNGKRVETSVTAFGSGLTYQWYYRNSGSTKFSKSSLTSDTYYVTMSSKANNREVYCLIKDKYGNSVKSDIVTLKKASPVKITTQPTNKQVPLKETIKVKVVAKGDGLKYQWYVKDIGNDSFVKSSIKSSTYSYKMTTAKSGRQVYCIITDQYGCKVQSKTVTLSASVSVTKQPVDVSAKSGDQVTTNVNAFGSGLTYQWYYRNSGSSKFSKSSLASDTYYVNMSKKVNGREIYCVITDKFGNSVQTDTVTLSLIK